MSKKVMIWEDHCPDSICMYFQDPVIVITFNREDLSLVSDSEEMSLPGIYILCGKDTCYVGQASGKVINRIKSHDIQKNWWDCCIAIVHQDGRLDRGQLDFLEKTLIGKMRESNVPLDNNNGGNSTYMGWMQRNSTKQFLAVALKIIACDARLDIFDAKNYAPQKDSATPSKTYSGERTFMITDSVGNTLSGRKFSPIHIEWVKKLCEDENFVSLLRGDALKGARFWIGQLPEEKSHLYAHIVDDLYTNKNYGIRDRIKEINRVASLLGITVEATVIQPK